MMKNKKKIRYIMGAVMVMLCLSVTACGAGGKSTGSSAKEASSAAKKTQNISEVSLTQKQLETLTDARVLSGVQDYTVEIGIHPDLKTLVAYDKSVISNMNVDDTAVDFAAEGDYPVLYRFTIDNAALTKLLKKQKIDPIFNGNIDLVNASCKANAKIASKEAAQQLAQSEEQSAGQESGAKDTRTKTAVITGDNYQAQASRAVQAVSNPETAAAAAAQPAPAGTPSAGPAGQSGSPSGNSGNTGSGSSAVSQPETGSPKPASDQKAEHVHKWVKVTCPVYHPATGHYETVVLRQAWDQERGHYEYHTLCESCGAYIEGLSEDERVAHIEDHMLRWEGSGYHSVQVWVPEVIHHDAVTTQQWVTDSEPWTEEVFTGTYQCSECGLTTENP